MQLAAREPRPQWILIAAEPITDVDTTAADMLAELDQELNATGTYLVFAELKDPVRAKLERYALIGPLDPDHFFPTLEAAVDAFREHAGVDWEPDLPPTRSASRRGRLGTAFVPRRLRLAPQRHLPHAREVDGPERKLPETVIVSTRDLASNA